MTAQERKDGTLARAIVTNDVADPQLLELYARGSGIWVTISETNGRGRKSTDVVRFRSIWQEDDGGFDGELPLEPGIVVVTSPGKCHRYWLIADDWPADEQGRRDHAAALDRLVADYGSDNGAKGPNRVLRVPGFLHRKNPGNPHMVRISSATGRRYTRAEILQAFPPPERKPKAGNGAANERLNFTRPGVDIERIRDALRHIPADDRDDWLKVGMALKAELGDEGRPLWDDWSASCSEKYSDRDQDRTWRSFKSNGIGIGTVFQYARDRGWRPAEDRDYEQLVADIAASQQPKANGHDALKERRAFLESTTASIVKMRAIEWMWPNRFALGALGLIVGHPDKGKGLITYSIAACVTANLPLPCNEGRTPQGNVIILQAEDDIARTVVPRLAAAGADLERVSIVTMMRTDDKRRPFSLLTDLEALRAKIDEVGNVVEITIDPVSAYLGVGKVHNWSTTDVRGFLTPLTELAVEKNVAIIGVMHFNKKSDEHNALLRISDSGAYGAAARHVFAALDDPEIEGRRLLAKAKNNLGPDTQALSYMIGMRKVGFDDVLNKEIWAPYAEWGTEHVKVTANEAMQADAGGGQALRRRKEAEQFLQERLAGGPVKYADLLEGAKANGITEATLRRAKTGLGIRAEKEKGKVDGGWFWEMPRPGKPSGLITKSDEPGEDDQLGTEDHLEHLEHLRR
jgi:putative DNA primase/helicase